jgi:hypothetical protein
VLAAVVFTAIYGCRISALIRMGVSRLDFLAAAIALVAVLFEYFRASRWRTGLDIVAAGPGIEPACCFSAACPVRKAIPTWTAIPRTSRWRHRLPSRSIADVNADAVRDR